MPTVFLDMAMSLDGFISGPADDDLGLHDWYFAPSGDGAAVVDELLESIGAMILGRRAFGDAPDGFDTPYRVPHFVLTHQARPSVTNGGATFHFVHEGIERALEHAIAAASGKDVCVAGGADTARQFLDAGLLDEVRIHLVPKIFGGGRRLFGHSDLVELEVTRVRESPGATHLRYRVLKEPPR